MCLPCHLPKQLGHWVALLPSRTHLTSTIFVRHDVSLCMLQYILENLSSYTAALDAESLGPAAHDSDEAPVSGGQHRMDSVLGASDTTQLVRRSDFDLLLP